MRYIWIILIAALVFLAGSSGITKIMQMPQDIEFFGRFGFNKIMVIGFGILQLIGAVLLVFNKKRILGATVVFLTFLASLVFLLRDGNVPFSIVTIVAMAALVALIVRTRQNNIPIDKSC